MKLQTLLLCLLSLSVPAQDKPAPDPAKQLAFPLRKYDLNKDGLLTGDEVRLARQAHNRGGREAEPTENRWRDILSRLENEFTRRRRKDFDLNGDGKTEGPEQEEMRKVWRKIAERYSVVRREITAKYDRNDDGELSEQERNDSREESERRRREIEERAVTEWRASRAAKPAAEKPAQT